MHPGAGTAPFSQSGYHLIKRLCLRFRKRSVLRRGAFIGAQVCVYPFNHQVFQLKDMGYFFHVFRALSQPVHSRIDFDMYLQRLTVFVQKLRIAGIDYGLSQIIFPKQGKIFRVGISQYENFSAYPALFSARFPQKRTLRRSCRFRFD